MCLPSPLPTLCQDSTGGGGVGGQPSLELEEMQSKFYNSWHVLFLESTQKKSTIFVSMGILEHSPLIRSTLNRLKFCTRNQKILSTLATINFSEPILTLWKTVFQIVFADNLVKADLLINADKTVSSFCDAGRDSGAVRIIT